MSYGVTIMIQPRKRPYKAFRTKIGPYKVVRYLDNEKGLLTVFCASYDNGASNVAIYGFTIEEIKDKMQSFRKELPIFNY